MSACRRRARSRVSHRHPRGQRHLPRPPRFPRFPRPLRSPRRRRSPSSLCSPLPPSCLQVRWYRHRPPPRCLRRRHTTTARFHALLSRPACASRLQRPGRTVPATDLRQQSQTEHVRRRHATNPTAPLFRRLHLPGVFPSTLRRIRNVPPVEARAAGPRRAIGRRPGVDGCNERWTPNPHHHPAHHREPGQEVDHLVHRTPRRHACDRRRSLLRLWQRRREFFRDFIRRNQLHAPIAPTATGFPARRCCPSASRTACDISNRILSSSPTRSAGDLESAGAVTGRPPRAAAKPRRHTRPELRPASARRSGEVRQFPSCRTSSKSLPRA